MVKKQTKITLILLIIAMLLPMANAAIDDEIIVYYTHDDDDVSGSISIDSAEYSNGTITGAATGQTGIFNEAFWFDGINDYVDMNKVLLSSTGNFTITGWFNASATTNEPIIAQYTAGQAGRFIIYVNGGVLTAFSNSNFQVSSTTTIDADSWYFFTVTKNGTNVSIYINNTYENSGTATGSIYQGVNTRICRSDVYCEGQIDEIGLWNRSLNETERTQIYESGLVIPLTFPSTMSVSAYDTTGTNLATINSITVTGDDVQIQTTNPFEDDITDYIANCNESKNITVTIDSDAYQPYTNTFNLSCSNYNINITLTAYQLELSTEQAGSPMNVTAIVLANNGTSVTGCFNSTPITITQQDFIENEKIEIAITTEDPTNNCTIGNINMYNFTQYYEYINDWGSVTDTIEILNQDRDAYYTYFEVLGYSGRALEDVLVRCVAPFTYTNNGWVQNLLISQRFTDANGKTFIYGEEGQQLQCTFLKDGFTAYTLTDIAINDENRDETNPHKVYMEPNLGIRGTGNYTAFGCSTDYLNCPSNCASCFTNRSEDINCTMISFMSSPYLNTQYRLDLGLSNFTVSGIGQDIKIYNFQLQPTVHFSQTGNDNITVYIWSTALATPIASRKICYVTDQYNSIFNQDTGSIDDGIMIMITILAILVITSAVGILFKNDNIGVATFMICSIIAAFIHTNFLWLLAIGVIYYGAKGAKKFISE